MATSFLLKLFLLGLLTELTNKLYKRFTNLRLKWIHRLGPRALQLKKGLGQKSTISATSVESASPPHKSSELPAFCFCKLLGWGQEPLTTTLEYSLLFHHLAQSHTAVIIVARIPKATWIYWNCFCQKLYDSGVEMMRSSMFCGIHTGSVFPVESGLITGISCFANQVSWTKVSQKLVASNNNYIFYMFCWLTGLK